MDTPEKHKVQSPQDLTGFSGYTGGKPVDAPKVSCRGGKKKPAQWRANEGMVGLDAFGSPDDCGGIHAAKNTGEILRKLDAVL